MGYSEYLKMLLRPMGVYDLESGYNVYELNTLGAALDKVCVALDVVLKEAAVPNAETFGLTKYEEILPKIPFYGDIERRRDAIQALLRIDDTSFTLKALNDAVLGCGLKAAVSETDKWYTVSVTFPEVRGVPPKFDKIKERIESIIPCHLNVIYIFTYIIWNELEEWFLTWNELEGAELTWDELQVYEE